MHASTTDLPAEPETANEVPPAQPLCGGTAFQVANTMKTQCLHVKGGAGAGGFSVSAVKRPVITAACTPGSPNQMFSFVPSAVGGMLRHDASQMVISLASNTVTNGAGVYLAAPQTGAVTQEWAWSTPDVGGVIAAVANANFEITDSRVNAGADVAIGLPVHMWHLAQSLPSGAPNAQWVAKCGN